MPSEIDRLKLEKNSTAAAAAANFSRWIRPLIPRIFAALGIPNQG